MGEGVAAASTGRGFSLYKERDFQLGEKLKFVKGSVWASVEYEWINQHSYHRKEFRRIASGDIR